MKKPKFLRLRLLVGLSPGGNSHRRGVAIITVLAIISLMAVLVVSFFNMAQSTKISAIGSVEMQRVTTLKDTVTNLVMAQIRQATTLQGTDSQQVLWTSQPGAIRTYHGSNTSLTRMYKLYSAETMMLDSIGHGGDKSTTLLNEIQKDVDVKWDEYLDMYVDLNRPSLPSSAVATETNATELKARLVYPIADPRRYIGQKSAVASNTEGFSYGERSLDAPQVNGVDATKMQLAMPVRWIYLLKDGTSGVVDKEGKFRAISKDGGSPSKENPIVSRIAWWTDDESCKININVASLPIPWDTPRTNSAEDLWYAQHQPVNGECQHYPGHPAQTDLCAVLFPSFRYTPDTNIFPVGGDKNPLPPEWARLVWNIAPYITAEGGSEGGTKQVNILSMRPVDLDINDRLYTTADEVYFKAKKLDENIDRPRESVSDRDQGGRLLDRLQGAGFFLTTRSSSPEATVFGTPRICMYPMNERVKDEVGKANGQVDPTVGSFEVTMATASTLGMKPGVAGSGKPYYFMRRSGDAGSRHSNFFKNVTRDAQLFRYLKQLTNSIPPGYPELSADFNTFELKYPGPNGKDGDKPNDKGDPDSFDSSDRSQILLSMLDYLRSSNMAPGYLQNPNIYDTSGGGQVAGICGCMRIKSPGDNNSDHATILNINPALHTYYSPKGAGRTYGPSEFAFFANVTAIKKGSKQEGQLMAWGSAPDDSAAKWGAAKQGVSQIQVGVVMNAFCARQGWAPLFPESGIRLMNVLNKSANDAESPPTGMAPFLFSGGFDGRDRQMFLGLDSQSYTTSRIPAHIPWGGNAGPRVSGFTATTVASFAPIIYDGPGAGETSGVTIALKWKLGEVLRIAVYDEGGANVSNITQIIDLADDGDIKLSANYTGKNFALYNASPEVNGLGPLNQNAPQFPPNKTTFSSFVVPHGDYRLTTIPLRVERGIFVPHASGENSFTEPLVVGGSDAIMVKLPTAKMSQIPLLTSTGPPIPEKYAPHFAPSKLPSIDLGAKPNQNVINVASRDPNRAQLFSHGRRDGVYQFTDTLASQGAPRYARDWAKPNKIPNRGSSDPVETGDFDNGIALAPDGPYINSADDGDARDATRPYFARLTDPAVGNPASFTPNRVMRSPVEFGSLPSGIQARVPWQTLRFRPDPGMYGDNQYKNVAHQPKQIDGYNHYFPFSNYCGPKDHLLLDMFWMPIVEPWAISEGFATKGLINLNQQILPFTYIQRTTALHALLRSERMMAIPDSAATDYKDGAKLPDGKVYRHWINAKETIRQITDFRWRGRDAEGHSLPFNTFRSASEVCELWLVPDKNGNESGDWDLDYTIKKFWQDHRLTGDNMRERPYSNLYPRVTVRSNVYKIHMVAQTLKKADSNIPGTFSSIPKEGADPDQITAEWRGSAIVERGIDPNEPGLQKDNMDYLTQFSSAKPTALPRLDSFYTYRVTEVKSFNE